ncbi:MAG: hypothetical protein KKF44_02945 [Nanoarchaeota archaeon]|nr:hypothetical protein [Nanoarchaeota archaeon]
MAISERQLEENEAKIDNILHKILNCCNHIQTLSSNMEELDLSKDANILKDRTKRISLLAETIENLALLADKIDIENEKITEEIEDKITSELDVAIEKIKDASEMFKKEKYYTKQI